MIRFLAFEKTKMPDLQKNYVKIAASSSGMGYLMAEKKTAAKKAEKKENNKNTWLKYTEAEVKEVFEVCEGYKAFISDCKTERECVDEVVRQAKAEGYKDLFSVKKVKAEE